MGKSNKKKIRKPRGYWDNKENILQEIKNIEMLGIELNSKSAHEQCQSLYSAARKLFGSWEEAVNQAGINYDNHRIRKSWTREKVIVELWKMHSSGANMNSGTVSLAHSELFSACRNLFGDYKSAIYAANINYDEIKLTKEWNEEKVIIELKKRYDSKLPMNYKEILGDDRHLVTACVSHFGSYRSAIEVCGWNYDKLTRMWTKEKIINEIKTRNENGLSLSLGNVRSDDYALFNACIHYFGSYKDAITASGLNYDDIREDRELVKYYGHKFECLLENILDQLNVRYTKGYSFEYRPDFVFAHNKWVDAKLSEWTIHCCDTIEKYEPHCRFLTIVYMRGNKEFDEMITKKTRLISVHKLIKQLPRYKQKYYISLIEEMLNEINKLHNNEY